jgi:long-chain acyl-CoA synthetase
MTLLHYGLEDAAHRNGEGPALWSGDDTWTFAALEARSNRMARRLAELGVRAGSRVAVMMANRPEFVIAVHAVSKLGGASVLLNPAWKALEVGHALNLTGPAHAVADGPSAELLVAGIDRTNIVDLDVAADALAAEARDGHPLPRPAVSTSAESVLVFSSGTTGLPKAVRHTHASMAAAIEHWRDCLGLGPDDRFQVATPPSHILGLLNLVTAISAGTPVRLHRRFDLDEILARIQSERMTLEMAVAPIALALANHPDLEKYDLTSLRYIMWGATPVTPSVAEMVTERTGVRWLPAYGASELPVLAANPVDQPDQWRLDSAGRAPRGVDLRVVDLDTGLPQPWGETGELQARSPSVMAGYLPDDANSDAFADGWYRTGDVGWMEEGGWVHLTDRSKEMIKVNGFQVAPAELEAVLHGQPGVADCAVFGVPDPRSGEVPVAAVELHADAAVTPDQLMKVVGEALASYKRLHEVVIVDSIPRLPSGKVLRRVLRDEWSEKGKP